MFEETILINLSGFLYQFSGESETIPLRYDDTIRIPV